MPRPKAKKFESIDERHLNDPPGADRLETRNSEHNISLALFTRVVYHNSATLLILIVGRRFE